MATPKSTTVQKNSTPVAGQRFGRWVIIREVERQRGIRMVRCACDCGTESNVSLKNMMSGKSQSCGCLRRRVMSETKVIHGQSGYRGKDRGPLYMTWTDMRRRCYTPTARSFAYYGARGVKVCDRWMHGDGVKSGYECFANDMGSKPTPQHSLDRIDVNGDYSAQNCRWATADVQANNKRSNRLVQFRGQRMNIGEAIRLSGIPEWTVYERLARGWTPDDALNRPVSNRGRKRKPVS